MDVIRLERLVGKVQTSSESDYVKDGVLYIGANPRPVIVEDESQLDELPDDVYAPGSMARLAGYTKLWEKAADGTWVPMVK